MFLASNLKKPKENQCFCPIIALGVLLAILGNVLIQNGPLGVLLVILGTILRGILYIHKLPINRKAADTCSTTSIARTFNTRRDGAYFFKKDLRPGM